RELGTHASFRRLSPALAAVSLRSARLTLPLDHGPRPALLQDAAGPSGSGPLSGNRARGGLSRYRASHSYLAAMRTLPRGNQVPAGFHDRCRQTVHLSRTARIDTGTGGFRVASSRIGRPACPDAWVELKRPGANGAP